jgi:hypothetical protein
MNCKKGGAASKHSCDRLIQYCGFNGSEHDARRFIAMCRKAAGRNKQIVISAKNLGISKKAMRGVECDKHYVNFFKGQAPTILSFTESFGRGDP